MFKRCKSVDTANYGGKPLAESIKKQNLKRLIFVANATTKSTLYGHIYFFLWKINFCSGGIYGMHKAFVRLEKCFDMQRTSF